MGTSHTPPGKLNYRGLDLEKTSPLRSKQKFFLDIPFDRTHCAPDCRYSLCCCAASDAWNETTLQCPAWRTYVFVKRQSSESSCPFITRVRCRRPVTTAASPYRRM